MSRNLAIIYIQKLIHSKFFMYKFGTPPFIHICLNHTKHLWIICLNEWVCIRISLDFGVLILQSQPPDWLQLPQVHSMRGHGAVCGKRQRRMVPQHRLDLIVDNLLAKVHRHLRISWFQHWPWRATGRSDY